ncbi:hypothetical protein MNBD_NITROSPINAE04-1948 [hydrothermal vent metagenome]|uniref:Uncharacterized protein n=1 Tax=hydrothermal vent metagenome TaxID=652676 RepID=A0A3B1BAV9_9ZZZZ
MTQTHILDDPRLLLLVTGLAWSALIALLKKAVNAVENKIDDNAKKVSALQSEMATIVGDTKYRIERNFRDLVDESRTDIKELGVCIENAASERRDEIAKLEREHDEKMESLRRECVSRHEFRLLSINMNEKIETIHKHIISNGVKD